MAAGLGCRAVDTSPISGRLCPTRIESLTTNRLGLPEGVRSAARVVKAGAARCETLSPRGFLGNWHHHRRTPEHRPGWTCAHYNARCTLVTRRSANRLAANAKST